jgi:hypothetical protein
MCLRRAPEKYITGAALDKAALKSRSVSLHFLVITRNKNEKKNNYNNLNFLLLIEASTFSMLRAPHNVNPALGEVLVSSTI